MSRVGRFFVNLDREPARLAFMTEQFARLDLEVERVPAVDGRAPDGLAGASVAPYAPLSSTEAGCFESHLAIWRLVVERGLDAALVLEDDVVIASDLPRILEALPGTVPFDLIKLDQWFPSVPVAGPAHPLAEGRTLRRLAGRDLTTSGYVVSNAGARKLLAEARGYYRAVDHFMFDPADRPFHALETYKLLPPAVTQLRYGEDPAAAFPSGIDRGRPRARTWSEALRMRLRRLVEGDTRYHRALRLRRMAARQRDVSDNTVVMHDPAHDDG